MFEDLSIDRRKTHFHLADACRLAEDVPLPECGESVRVISPDHGFSSAALIHRIFAEKSGISELYATTLRVGKKEADLLCKMGIPVCQISAHGIMRENDGYYYSDDIERKFENVGYVLRYVKNHSKVILIKTFDGDRYVIETSSNLNENPKIEQFCITNSEELFAWYYRALKDLGVFL